MGNDSILISWLGRLPVYHDPDDLPPDETKLVEICTTLESQELHIKAAIQKYCVKYFDENLTQGAAWAACSAPSMNVRSDGVYCLRFESRFDDEHGLSILV